MPPRRVEVLFAMRLLLCLSLLVLSAGCATTRPEVILAYQWEQDCFTVWSPYEERHVRLCQDEPVLGEVRGAP